MTTTTTTTAVDRLLEVVTGTRVAGTDIYAADAVFDAIVPNWRFPVRGVESIGYQLAEWFQHPGRLEELERHPTPTGEVLTYTVTWEEAGVPHAARHAHVLTILDDRITRDQVWCGGRWPAPLLAQMEAAQR
jgi:hypothetical protein